MKKIILFLILLAPSSSKSQDSLLLIKKGELAWLLEVYDEREVLKKRVVLKQATIDTLQSNNATLRTAIAASDTIIKEQELQKRILLQEANNNKEELKIFREVYPKLTKQNRLLKWLVGGLVVYGAARSF